MNKEFCPECSNMLYPKEDTSEKQLYMACRNCEHVEEATSYKVVENVFHREFTEEIDPETAKDMTMDPTLFIASVKCVKCGYGYAVYFEPKGNNSDIELKVCYICRKCYHIWM